MKINDISMQDLEKTGFIIMKAMRTIFKYIIGITLILSIAYACSEELTTTDNILSKNQESLIKTRGWHDNRNSYDYDYGLYSFGNWDAGQHDLNYQIKIYHGFH